MENVKELYKVFKNHTFKNFEEHFEFNYSKELESTLKSLKIEFDKIAEIRIDIQKSDLELRIYENETQYLLLSEIKKEGDIIILNSDPLVKFNSKTYINFSISDDDYFFQNAAVISKFINYLKSSHLPQESANFNFIDYFDDVHRKIVFTTAASDGRVEIFYYDKIPSLDRKIDYSKKLESFEKCFEDDKYHLPKFLKNSIIKNLSAFKREDRLQKLLENLDDIVSEAQINFEIYLNNLSIEKLKKDYEELKIKYLDNLSDILNKLTHKIIGYPLIVTTTLFAFEKIKDNDIFLGILLISILLTSVFLVFLTSLNFKDLVHIRILATKDFNILKANNFFLKYPNELEDFNEVYSRIKVRVKNLLGISEAYFWILSFSNIIFLIFIVYTIFGNLTLAIWLIPLLVLPIIYYRNNFIESEINKENDRTTKIPPSSC